jgi:gluconolactonase
MVEIMDQCAQEEKAERSGWQPGLRYPDPLIRSLDPGFDTYRLGNASVERLFTGARWGEGPVWFGDGRFFLWSDIPANLMRRWDEETGAVSVFRNPSSHSNGNTRDRQGRLVTHLTRRVTRTGHDGNIAVVCDSFKGKRLNSPNDVIVKSDDSIWFSDPPFGILGNYEGDKAELELLPTLCRVDGKSGAVAVVTDEIDAPNGLCFLPGERKLYVVETAPHSNIYVFDVPANGSKIANKKLFIDAGSDAASAATSTAICGAPGAPARGPTACASTRRTATSSASSRCQSTARTSASAGASATGCSWSPATRSMRSMSARRGSPAASQFPPHHFSCHKPCRRCRLPACVCIS